MLANAWSEITAAHVDAPFDFSFMEPDRAPDPMLTLHRMRKLGYGDTAISWTAVTQL
jgi:hypothetical protein